MVKYLLCLFFLALSVAAHADDQTITLKDGSQIKGELTSVANGVYTVRTATMGDVHVQADQVASINNGAAPAVPLTGTVNSSDPNLNAKMQTMQAQLMSNPEFVSQMQQMAQDPEIMQLLSDPALLQAVTSKDVNAIQNNPKAQELMSNPKFRDLIEKLRSSSSSSQ